MTATVLLIGTFDTKGDELNFVRSLFVAQGLRVTTLDAGIMHDPMAAVDIAASEVALAGGRDLEGLRTQGDRGVALEIMAIGAAELARKLHDEGAIQAVFGAGGSCGTAIATAAMRELPVGLPKVMVSTMASGNVAPYVGVKDVTMMYSVVDIAGLNRISRTILGNAVGAVVGMVGQGGGGSYGGGYEGSKGEGKKGDGGNGDGKKGDGKNGDGGDRPVVAATMFGVTTPCVERVRARLTESGCEVLVFHATGSGGRAMEGLIRSGFINAVADVTTTEWADELVGGVLSAGPDRLDAAALGGIPQVVSLGALDMVNFGGVETVPANFRERTLHVHNPSVTLMRTTADECKRLGEVIANKLNQATGAVTLMIPLRGVSALDKSGAPFHDPEADAALFDALRKHVGRHVKVVELDLHINDTAFADAIADELLSNMLGVVRMSALQS